MGVCYCKSAENVNNHSLNQSTKNSKTYKDTINEKPTANQHPRNKVRLPTVSTRRSPQSTTRRTRSQTTERDLAVNSELIVNCNRNSQKDSYKIMEKLGEGSYGTVWKVKQRKTHLIRAMKKITKNTNSRSETINEIINEIELLKKLDHPNIVKIFEFFIEPDGYYLICEY